MASKEKPVKRRLPLWMETLHAQTAKSQSSANNGSQAEKPENKESSMTGCIRACDEADSDLTYKEPKTGGIPARKNDSQKITASDIISSTMPWFTFSGSIIYSYQDSDCACICQDILSMVESKEEPLLLGFDMEWEVSFRQGSSNKTSLIQICPGEDYCYLFHVSSMYSFPKPLKDLITNSNVMLLGVNIESDLWKLERDFDVRVKPIIDRGSAIDVGKLANEKLKSSEKWSLDGLCKNILKKRLNKDTDLRCGEWNTVPLSKEQKLYAATDACAGLVIYKHLKNK